MVCKNYKKLVIWLVFTIIIVVGILCIVFIKPAIKYKDVIAKYSYKYNLDPALVCSIIRYESNFKYDVTSQAGAVGLMQIMPATAQEISIKLHENFSDINLFNADTNIRYGCYYVGYLCSQFDNLQCVLAAYNAGLGNVNRWLSNSEYSRDGIHLDYIPFAETREYVLNVSKGIKVYKKYW